MQSVCKRCGKKAYVNLQGECSQCAQKDAEYVDRDKWAEKTLFMKPSYESRHTTLWIVAYFLNILITARIMDYQCHTYYVWLYAAIAFIIMKTRVSKLMKAESKAYVCLREIGLNFVLNLVYLNLFKAIVGTRHSREFRHALVMYLFLFAIYGITNVLFKKIGRDRAVRVCAQKYLERESSLPDVNQLLPVDTRSAFDPEKDIIQPAIDSIAYMDLSDAEKQRLIQLVQDDEPQLKVNNDDRYIYCQFIDKLMKEKFKFDEEGCWICPENVRDDLDFFRNLKFPQYVLLDGKKCITNTFVQLTTRYEEMLPLVETLHSIYNLDTYIAGMQGFKKELIGTVLGHHGEARVEHELKPYEGQIIVIPNLRIEVEGESIENDFVLLTPYGIYVLEVKNLGSGGGYGLHIEKDGRWNKVYGRKESSMESPVHQNERHILYLEKYINKELGRNLDDYLRVRGMVVIANDKVDIRNESDCVVLRYTSVMSSIRNNPIVMKENEMKQIADILRKASLPAKTYEIANYMNFYRNICVYKFEYGLIARELKQLEHYMQKYKTEVIGKMNNGAPYIEVQ